MPELLITFGLSYILLELVQLVWGRSSVDYRVPASLDGPLFTLFGTQFPIYRGFMMAVAIAMLISVWLLLTRTRIGLVIQAALTHPEMAQALGHNVPRVFMLVFGGGAALAERVARRRIRMDVLEVARATLLRHHADSGLHDEALIKLNQELDLEQLRLDRALG